MSVSKHVDLASPTFKADPYPYYARLRAEAPVERVRITRSQHAWLVTRYDDVVSVLRDERFVKDRFSALTAENAKKQPWVPSVFRPLMRNMLDLDPPDHTRLRALVHKAFTPKLIETMRRRIESLTGELLDNVEGSGQMDLIRDYAIPVPTTIIAEMLGVPVSDQAKFHRWSSAIVSVVQWSTWGRLKAIPNVLRFLRYIRKLVDVRRKNPKEDLISALVAVEDTGDQLSEDELISMIFLLLIAGHETTVNLIGNGMLALLENPDQKERLQRQPDLIKPAVEELLRFDGPLETATERFAREDVEIAGVTIPRGELVFAVLASANRDKAQFDNPDVLDLAREPNRHIAFGLGVHYCLGASLARLEGQIAISTLLQRHPKLRLSVPGQDLRWRRGLVLRGLAGMPVSLTRS